MTDILEIQKTLHSEVHRYHADVIKSILSDR